MYESPFEEQELAAANARVADFAKRAQTLHALLFSSHATQNRAWCVLAAATRIES